MFMRYGVKSISMDDLSRELGISKKTLYQNVDSKEDLINKVILEHTKREVEEMKAIRKNSKNAIDEVIGIGRYIVRTLRDLSPNTMYDLKKYYRSCWDRLESLHKGYVLQVVKDNLNWGVKEGLYREEINTDIIGKLYMNKAMFLVDEDIFPLKEYKRDDLVKEHILYHLHGVITPKGQKLLRNYLKKEL